MNTLSLKKLYYIKQRSHTPSTSITSPDVERMPAVSAKITGYPRKFTVISMTSRVVPGIWETIAASRSPTRFYVTAAVDNLEVKSSRN